MINLGYAYEDVIKMIKSLPALYSYSMESIKQKINNIMTLGYTYEETIKMTKAFPSLYGYSVETLKQK